MGLFWTMRGIMSGISPIALANARLRMRCPNYGIDNARGSSSCGSCGANLLMPLGSAAPFPKEIAISSGFVGRYREMRDLRLALEDALSGQGRLVMLAGEPGIGKTRSQELTT
jgi:hypothetical protein